MTGQQMGPVEQGRQRPGPVPMDLDRAINVLDHVADPRTAAQSAEVADGTIALRALVDAARAYVRGPSPGRLEALAAALQEPIGRGAAPVDTETVVKAYLDQHDYLLITRELAARLGIGGVRARPH